MLDIRFQGLSTIAFLAALWLAPSAAEATFLGAQPVNVSVGFNTRVPLADLSEESLAEAQKAARERLYRLGRDECVLLKATIADSCRLKNLNVNTQIQQHNTGQPLLYINGSANFTISLKDEAPAGD